MNPFDISGRKAIVTGGSRGLGKGATESLLESGVETVIVASSDKVLNVAKEFQSKGYCCYAVYGDLSDPTETKRMFCEALERLGGELDILVNCAGVQSRHHCEEFPLEDWQRVLDVNLTATFQMCQLAANVMLQNGYGKIINFASMLSFFGGYTVPAYAASKGGVAQLTKALSNEWASHNINVNAIAPGYMDTDMNTALVANKSRNKEILARIPAKRWGTPQDIGGTVLFLASAASDYVNGAVIPVDGGYLGC